MGGMTSAHSLRMRSVSVPPAPSIYHITHVNNLAQIVHDGALLSDAVMITRGEPATTIGMSTIKLRRLKELRVKCHPEDCVGSTSHSSSVLARSCCTSSTGATTRN